MESAVLTVKEAAVILRISSSKMYQLLREGMVPHIKLGNRVVVPRAKFLNWIESATIGGLK
ncbi:MAG TPA: helix-turn-helix domain-containing protein [Clostridia bacterium]|nr:helix-turn-helix domain-containing protein [Clostridia bacterium]